MSARTASQRDLDDNGRQEYNGNNVRIDIQPLRDLARNFDIDIEPYLEEYLRETEGNNGVQNIHDPNAPPNFAQAALKIQNSTCIYNRKVDFLHQVAYEVLNEFIQSTIAGNNNAATGGKKRSSANNDAAIDEFNAFDAELEFLLLDDVLPVDKSAGRKKINLKMDDEGGRDLKNETGVNLDTTLATHAAGATPEVTLLSLGGVLSASKVDQSGSFMINRESLGRTSQSVMSRMLMTNLQGGNDAGEGNLRLVADRCDVGANGALLLPGTSASVVVNGANNATETANSSTIEIFPGGLSPMAGAGVNDACRENAEFDTPFGGCGDDFGHDDDHGVGFELNNEHDDDQCEFDGEEKKDEDLVVAPEQLDDKPPPEIEKVKDDPWAVHDPHEPSNDKARPLCIGVTFRLPPGLHEDDRPSALVTGSRTRTKVPKKRNDSMLYERRQAVDALTCPPFLADVTFDSTLRDENLDGEQLDKSDASLQLESNVRLKILKSNQLIFGQEFAYIAKAHAKHRDMLRRQRRLLQQSTRVARQNAEANKTNVEDYGEIDDDDDGYGGGFDFGGPDDDSYANNDGGQKNGKEPIHRSNVDFNAIDDVFASDRFVDNDLDGDGESTNAQQTFESLCRAHLRKFAKRAEIYAAETQLTKRVGIWQTGLVPILEEQERRPVFDIHSCGRQILQTVENSLSIKKRSLSGEKKLEKQSSQNNIVEFRTITKDCEVYEVCRRFLSTLMLCNCGNVALLNTRNGDECLLEDSLQIELLDAKFEGPMESFLAPSIADNAHNKENMPLPTDSEIKHDGNDDGDSESDE